MQIDSICQQCRVIIIDNGSEPDFLHLVSEYVRKFKDVELLKLDENIGISAAQNYAIKHAQQYYQGIKYFLLLDHDSVPPENMIAGLRDALVSLSAKQIKIAAIGPLLYDPRDKKHVGFHQIEGLMWKKVVPSSSSEPVECQSLNSSGSLITLSAIESVGLLNDTFFMDHGETEWCFRAISKGYKIFGTSSIEMEHLMGDRVYEYWFFGKKRMPYRAPLRHYYIIRNGILMQKMSFVPVVWKFWNIVKILFTFFYFGILGDSRAEHRRYLWKGIVDGVKGIEGKYRS